MESKAFELHDGKFPEYLLPESQLDNDENRALFHAAQKGDLHAVQAALKKGAKPNFFFHPEDHKNALHASAEKGFLDIVELLLEHGAVANAVSVKDHSTALILSATQSNPAIAERLIQAGANVNAANGYGNSALHEACFCGFFDVIKILVDSGANINATNHKGSTALHMFCYGEPAQKHPLDVAHYLLDHGADVNTADSRGMTPLLVACSTGREDLVNLFLQNGARQSARDATGRGPAEIATFYRHQSIAAKFEADAKASHSDAVHSKEWEKSHK